MGFKNNFIRSYTFLPHLFFHKACENPKPLEGKLWNRLLKLYKRGSYWKTSNPLALSNGNLNAFEITDYESYKDAITTSKRSGVNPMTGEKILFYADSAGTTSYPKEFPITSSFRKDYQATQAPFVHRLTKDFPKFLDSPALYLTACNSSKQAECGVEIGYISNFNYRNMPKLLASFYGLPKEVLRDEATFNKWAPVYAVSQNISAIFVITPFVLCNFFKLISKNRDRIRESLKNPTRVPSGFPSLSVSPRRVQELELVFQEKNLRITKLWSNLSFICTWKASLAGLQVPQLKEWVPDIPIIDGTYSATEAWFNVPLSLTELGGPLSHRSGIFEFIPSGKDIQKKHLLRSWQLEKGQDYEVFVTTSMGMIRYRLKDIVHCSGHLQRSPILYFKSKAENQISLTTLRLSEDQLAHALSRLNISDLSHIRIAPASDGTGLVLALSEESGLNVKVEDFEKALCETSPYYKEERESEHVGSSRVITLPKNHIAFARSPQHAQSKPKLVAREPFA